LNWYCIQGQFVAFFQDKISRMGEKEKRSTCVHVYYNFCFTSLIIDGYFSEEPVMNRCQESRCYFLLKYTQRATMQQTARTHIL